MNNQSPSMNQSQALLSAIQSAASKIPVVVAKHLSQGERISSFSQLLESPHLREVTGAPREGWELALQHGWFKSERELNHVISHSLFMLESLSKKHGVAAILEATK